MHVTKKQLSDTVVKLSIEAGETYLTPIKNQVLERLRGQVKLPGFREGKAPVALIEKNVDQNVLQSEFIDEALNRLYQAAVRQEDIRPIDQPQVTLKKFVPFSELSFEIEVNVLGSVKLADYKKIKKTKKEVKVTDKDIQEVLANLQTRMAERKEVTRASKKGDEALIDFAGTDTKSEPIKGADGKDYPLVLGSDTFIPGFEDNVIGLKAGEEKTFVLTFPKDYGVKALANKKVTFVVTIKKVSEIIEPKLDDTFAAKVGPFKSLADLKADIKKQLVLEKQNQAKRELENELVKEIADKSTLSLPQILVNEQIEGLVREVTQNATYRGQTYKEFLEQEGKTDEQYRNEVLKPEAELRVKVGLVLAEIAKEEKVNVTPEELEIRLQLLKGQYQDPAMQAELEKPEARQDIASRMLSEKTVNKLIDYATK